MLFFRRALDDIFKNIFLNLITVITISLSILITSAFILFFINTGQIINSWQKGLRIMAYLKPGINNSELEYLKQAIQALDGVQRLRYIPKQEALNLLLQATRSSVATRQMSMPAAMCQASRVSSSTRTN